MLAVEHVVVLLGVLAVVAYEDASRVACHYLSLDILPNGFLCHEREVRAVVGVQHSLGEGYESLVLKPAYRDLIVKAAYILADVESRRVLEVSLSVLKDVPSPCRGDIDVLRTHLRRKLLHLLGIGGSVLYGISFLPKLPLGSRRAHLLVEEEVTVPGVIGKEVRRRLGNGNRAL